MSCQEDKTDTHFANTAIVSSQCQAGKVTLCRKLQGLGSLNKYLANTCSLARGWETTWIGGKGVLWTREVMPCISARRHCGKDQTTAITWLVLKGDPYSLKNLSNQPKEGGTQGLLATLPGLFWTIRVKCTWPNLHLYFCLKLTLLSPTSYS